MSNVEQLPAAVAAGRFTANQAALLEAALECPEPWSGAALLRRRPERSRTAFYRALKSLHERGVIVAVRPHSGKWKGKWKINPAIDEWKNRAGDGPLFAENTPEAIGFKYYLGDTGAQTEKPLKPKKPARLKPAVVETMPRPGTDANGDQPGQQHLTDPSGTDFNKKEPDIWERTAARLKAANRRD